MSYPRLSQAVKEIDAVLRQYHRIVKNESLGYFSRRSAACELLFHFNCQVPIDTTPKKPLPEQAEDTKLALDPLIAIEDALEFLLDPNMDPQLSKRTSTISEISVNGGWRALCKKRTIQNFDVRQVLVEVWHLERSGGKAGQVIISSAGLGWHFWKYGLRPKWNFKKPLGEYQELLDPGATLAQLREPP